MGVPWVLRGHEARVFSARFSPDGQRIVTSAGDNTARLWPTNIPELRRRLHEANADCLSPETRRTYLDEREVQAQDRYEECERSYGRPPVFTKSGVRPSRIRTTLRDTYIGCPVYQGERCYWMGFLDIGTWLGWCMVPATWASDRHACYQLDSCYGGLSASGGGCYKWANTSEAPVAPW